MIKMGLVDEAWPLSPDANDYENAKDKEFEERCMEVYAAMVDSMDQGIGRIIEALETTGEFQNTLIFFIADNGGCAEGMGRRKLNHDPDKITKQEPMGADELQTDMIPKKTRDGKPMRQGYGVLPGPADTYIGYGEGWANASNTPFRLYKHYVHEGGISSPLIAHWPDGIARKGEFESQPGHLIDLMATAVDLSKAKYPAEFNGEKIQPMEGKSLAPAFTGAEIKREAIYWEHEGNRAVRVGDWKLVAKGRNGPWELYDLKADRTELNNLVEKNPEKTKELAALWQTYAERTNVLPWPGQKKKK
jgi:arylsulfatase A-like enzyme